METCKVINVAPADDLRAQSAARVFDRLWNNASTGAETIDTATLDAIVRDLRRRGLISFDPEGPDGTTTLRYAPSIAAKEFSASASEGWGPKVQKFIKQSVKAVPGAVFDLPFESNDGGVEAFITDWSPFPAACAVAIHPSNGLADGVQNQANISTGIYVRHPLHGDLMPVWTADWVKPEFGTGVVIINPAHSAVDLQFARRVGLPVRFGLAPVQTSQDSKTWVTPPFINAGIAVRTGIADGIPAPEAKERYLATLTSSGRGRPFTDRVMGRFDVCSLATTDVVDWVRGEDVEIDWFRPALQCLSAPVPGRAAIVTSNRALDSVLLVRALQFDAFGHSLKSPIILGVGQSTWQVTDSVSDAVRDLALIVAAKNDDVSSVKKQNVDQVVRFFETHEKLVRDYGDTASGDSSGQANRMNGVFSLIVSGQFSTAFAELYKVQRDYSKNPDSVSEGDRTAYFTGAHILAGTPSVGGLVIDEVLAPS